ncbi:MAG: NADH-quinone oxidoreductase subunit H, partial [Candidatus Diapherotrites archaeon]|nr:NADH-quinone oxidoreductase subunit H [Candidatus Diapherotrites archaeon]
MDEVFALTDFVPIVYALVVLIVGPIVALLFSGIDRKLVARLQARYGPPIMQPFYDVRKLMLKQTIVPKHAVGWIFSWAPVIALTAALALLLFVPIASYTAINGDLILIWYLLLFPSLALVVGGFAAGSPYAAIGAQREMVMMSSYEMPLSVVALAIAYTLNTFSMNAIQMSPIWGNVGILGILGFLVLFVVMLIGIAPELAKVPFDIPEAETEIAGGLLTEYSG